MSQQSVNSEVTGRKISQADPPSLPPLSCKKKLPKNQLVRIHFFETPVQGNFKHIPYSSLSNSPLHFTNMCPSEIIAVTIQPLGRLLQSQSSHCSSCGEADGRSEGNFENIQLSTFHLIGGAFCQGCVHKPLDNFKRIWLF